MKEYTIVRKRDWRDVPKLEMTERVLVDFNADIRACCRVCYDDEALHVRLEAKEAEIRAEQTGDFQMPCEDSCLEFFFCPDEGSTRYFNIEMNPNCSLYLGIGETGIADSFRLGLPEGPEFSLEAVSERTEDGWRLTYRIPYRLIRFFFPAFSPKSGDRMRANAYKCGDLCREEHYLAWNPVDPSVRCCFHNPACFGTMIFE